MADLSAFDRPQETIAWAREAVAEFGVEFHRFFNAGPYGAFTDVDPETGHKIHKVKLLTPLPPVLARKATEALLHIRHSFDQSLYAGCVAIGKPPRNDIHFPWRRDPTDLEATFHNRNSVIPPEFWDVLRREEPYPTGDSYPGGDDAIRELAKIANRKHTVGLVIQAHVAGTAFMISSARNTDYLSTGGGGGWDPLKNEIILAVYSGDVQFDQQYSIASQVTFDITPPLGGLPVQKALDRFADKAEHFLEALKAECARIIT